MNIFFFYEYVVNKHSHCQGDMKAGGSFKGRPWEVRAPQENQLGSAWQPGPVPPQPWAGKPGVTSALGIRHFPGDKDRLRPVCGSIGGLGLSELRAGQCRALGSWRLASLQCHCIWLGSTISVCLDSPLYKYQITATMKLQNTELQYIIHWNWKHYARNWILYGKATHPDLEWCYMCTHNWFNQPWF